MAKGYRPSTLSGQVQWARTFANVVGEEPAAFGVPEALITQFAVLSANLQAAWAISEEPTTRTHAAIVARDNALRAMWALASQLVSIIQGTPSVTDDMKVRAGLTVRKTTRTRRGRPGSKPYVVVTQTDGRIVTIELRQDAEKRGKPANAVGANIFTATGPEVPPTPEGWTFLTGTTETTVTIPFPPSETGDKVWITAFWKNSRDESGPAARPVSVDLPAGTALPQGVAKPKTIKLAA